MNLNEDHLRVLTALRGATVLRREPKTLTPDGHEKWWSLMELIHEGRLTNPNPPAMPRAARALRKNRLVSGRTQYGTTRYAITPDGLLALASYEAGHGLAEAASALLDLDQAREDEARARDAWQAAQARTREAEMRVASVTRNAVSR
jgi:hypothetical protein